MRFATGDTVICVDDTVYFPLMQRYYRHWPTVGENYVIRAAVLVNGREGVYLEGVFNQIHPFYGKECGYYGFRFAKAPKAAERGQRDLSWVRSRDGVL